MVAMALWHLELHPDEPEQVYVRRDFQITNIALGEDINDDARCVVKVTHSPINPALLSDSESEDEYDEDEDEEDDEDDDEDEDEDDEAAEEAAMKKKGKVGGKVSVLEGKTVEELEDEAMDSDFDGEGESDDDSDFSLDMEPATAVIAALTPGKIEQASTNLVFTQGEAVIFEVTGKNVVHLMGNYIQQDMPHEHDDYDDLDSELDDDEDDEDEDDEFDDESITEEEAEDMEKMFGGNKRVELLDSKPAAAEGKKRKAETQEVDSPVSAAKSAVSAAASAVTSAAASAANALTGATATTDGEPLSKAAKKKLAKKQKLESGEAAEGVTDKVADKAKEVADKVAASAAPKKEDAKVSKRTTPSGLVIEDKKLGDGPVAKAGKRLGMRYIGKLTNGKQFDANTGGAPFKFVLGRGEVIKGWDEGIAGMKVGGERRLTIPPNLAYGSQKIPGIPPKSTLVFDIKLVSA